jgi:hypothetical protein
MDRQAQKAGDDDESESKLVVDLQGLLAGGGPAKVSAMPGGGY